MVDALAEGFAFVWGGAAALCVLVALAAAMGVVRLEPPRRPPWRWPR